MRSASSTGPGDLAGLMTSYKQVYNLEQVYLKVGDQHQQILSKVNMPLLGSSAAQDQEMIFRLCLITAFQFAETQPDSAAIEATRTRKDWKYALHLPVNHSTIAAIDLCKFRESLITSPKSMKEFGKLLDYLGKIGLFAIVIKETLDAGEVVTEVCRITRFDHLYQSMQMALNLLAATHPGWLNDNNRSINEKHYQIGLLNQNGRSAGASLKEEAVRMGKDILHLLVALNEQNLCQIADQVEIQQISHLLRHEFICTVDQMCWRDPLCATCTYKRAGG